MRIRVGHDAWLDVGPGVGRSSGHGGSLVIGDPTPSRVRGKPDIRQSAGRTDAARLRDANEPPPPGCELTGNCHHGPCTTLRAREVQRLFDADPNVSYTELGRKFGGRDRSTIKYFLTISDRPT